MNIKKAIACLLIGCAIVLTAQPVALQGFSPIQKEGSRHAKCCKLFSGQNHSSKDCCPKGGCSPFTVCGYSLVYLVSPSVVLPAPVSNEGTDFQSIPAEGKMSQYIASCFHPPEIVNHLHASGTA